MLVGSREIADPTAQSSERGKSGSCGPLAEVEGLSFDEIDRSVPVHAMLDSALSAVWEHFRGLPASWVQTRRKVVSTRRKRSEERRVGTECVSKCRSRWSQDN